MDRKDLGEILEKTNYPIAYFAFNEKVRSIPYIIYFEKNAVNIYGDNEIISTMSNYYIELYTQENDEAAEKSLEDVLYNAGINWDKEYNYIFAEELYQTVYSIQILKNI